MIELYIDGKIAILKDDFQADIVFENQFFTKSSSYSFDMELPMPTNYHIYGHINRRDFTKEKDIRPAQLWVNNSIWINGSAVLLDIENSFIKIQLVAGNAEFNLLANAELYLDELELGRIPHLNYLTPSDGVVTYPVLFNGEQLYNRTAWGKEAYGYYNRGGSYDCPQPYLWKLIELVLQHLGYSFDLSFFTKSWMKQIYVCNAIETDYYAQTLPHWTLSKFFSELENFLGVVILVNENNKEVQFVDLQTYYNSTTATTYISNSNLIDEYSVELKDESDLKELTSNNVSYKLPSHTDTYANKLKDAIFEKAILRVYDTYEELYEAWSTGNIRNSEQCLFQVGARFYVEWRELTKLKEVNLYADLIRGEGFNTLDLNIVPANIVSYNLGVYANATDYVTDNKRFDLFFNVPSVSYHKDVNRENGVNVQDVIEGKTSISSAKENDKMEVALISPTKINLSFDDYSSLGFSFSHDYYIPYIDFKQEHSWQKTPFPITSLCLNDVCVDSIGHRIKHIPTIKASELYKIYFKCNEIPNARNIFVIENKKYVCENITVTLNSNGVVPIVEGTFFLV